MRESKRIPKILNRIARVWKKYPDLRLAQLILNCTVGSQDLYYIEDEQLISQIEERDSQGLLDLY